ncbi:MAG: HAD-IC family P-type ATPase, partial [Pseudomonadota bacterium]
MSIKAALRNVWHHMHWNDAVDTLKSHSNDGLTSKEASTRLHLIGPNTVTTKAGTNGFIKFLLQFHNPLVYILLVAVAVTFVLEEYVDAAVIFAVVFLNAVIGFLQENKAEHAIESLKKMTDANALVIRDGERHEMPAWQIVPGDLILLQPGDKVPADMRLCTEKELKIDESALTGESLPADKNIATLDADTVLADRTNMTYAGTLVTAGQGKGVVIATGDYTETGKIARLMHRNVELETPLTKKIRGFSQVLLYIILGLSVFTFAVGMLHGKAPLETFMASVALAVATIPEGLPAVVTITLAIGVSRMASRNAIIRKLPAVETLGSATIICSDKTGTLTQNEMTVTHLFDGTKDYTVDGVGYAGKGRIYYEGQLQDGSKVEHLLLSGMLCNDAQIIQSDDGKHRVQGDPTEGALIVSAQKAALERKAKLYRRIDTIPFESDRMYMATLHNTPEDTQVAFIKGSVERILVHCETNELEKRRILSRAESYASKGLRVLAFASKEMANHTQLTETDVASGMVFLGLQAMIDPPRPEAIDAIKKCQAAGISVKMITGDHALTAVAIADDIGIFNNPIKALGEKVVTGKALSEMDATTLEKVALESHVFARVAPEQKLRLVTALQAQGHIVAMTGDGVNDAPALKQANIGIAMGITGTEVSKEAADMILLDDNFASIKAAVEEGRGVFDNLIKFITWILPTNIGQGLVILTAVTLGLTLPILPVQVLWLNMTTAVFLGLVLA